MKQWRAFWRNVWGILKELSDERAYERYLAAHGRERSREAWREFHDEHLTAKYKKPRCC